jgi:hypothetical protein
MMTGEEGNEPRNRVGPSPVLGPSTRRSVPGQRRCTRCGVRSDQGLGWGAGMGEADLLSFGVMVIRPPTCRRRVAGDLFGAGNLGVGELGVFGAAAGFFHREGSAIGVGGYPAGDQYG